MKHPLFLAFILAGVLAAPGFAQTNGIFADFTTSMGAFTCRLEYAKAPMAAANFIGLATGERACLEAGSARVHAAPYFGGLTFHRVIAGFMIQGGSPNGQGTDGPGYVFPDEFDPSLRFDGAGVLAMANSGPRSNGSQFFITVGNASWLNDVHTIFGSVEDGQAVVDAISQVATDASAKPLTNVVVQSVVIRRVGAEAQAFDIHDQGLPVVAEAPLALAVSNAVALLRFSNALYADNYLRESTNLTAWASTPLGVDIAEPVVDGGQIPADVPARFFSLSRVQYASSTFSPRDLFNRNLTMVFDGGIGTITNDFDGDGGGDYFYSGSAGTIDSYSWYQDIYRGYLWPIYYSGLVPMTLKLEFASETNGVFSGTAYSATPFDVSGSFTLLAP